jgi:hypothetical protein
MRQKFSDFIEKCRETDGPMGTLPGDLCGRFFIKHQGRRFIAVVSNGEDWKEGGLTGPAFEHVSLSTANRPPTWEEMCIAKDWFWEPEELVIQYPPPASEYVNFHPRCLHLWRPIGVAIPLPPSITVGPL